MIENGKFVPKWKHEYELKRGGHYDKVRELQQEIDRINDYNYDKIECRKLYQEIYEKVSRDLSSGFVGLQHSKSKRV